MRIVLALGLATAVVAATGYSTAGAARGAAAATSSLRAVMTSRQVVTPANKPWKVPPALADAKGTFAGRLVVSGGTRRVEWRLTYSGIGPSRLELADVHLGKPGKFGQVLVRLCGPCTSGQRGTKRVNAATAAAIKAGNSWITVITNKYPNGVIRGQIRVR